MHSPIPYIRCNTKYVSQERHTQKKKNTMSEIYTTFPFENEFYYPGLRRIFFEKCLEKPNDCSLMFEFNS